MSRSGRFNSLGACVLFALLLFGHSRASADGGKVTQKVGAAIPDSTAPGGGQITGLTVVIQPAQARTAGAKWTLLGGTTQSSSGDSISLLIADAGNRVLQFTTVSGFQVPIKPSVILAKGFQNTVTFTYAPLPPALPATVSAQGTRGIAFTFSPSVTGGPARSFAVAVGGGETLETLGLKLNTSTGRLSGTPAKSGTFSIVFTASNAEGASQPMTLTLKVVEPGELTVQADASRGSVTVSPKRANNLYGQTETVALTAKPKLPAFLFGGWQFTGGVTPTSLTSAMTSFAFSPTHLMVTATANFVPNPFLTRADTYAGRIAPASGITVTNTGTLSLVTTNLGSYTGRLKLGTGSYSFKGQFQPDGTAAAVTIKRPNKKPPVSDIVISQLRMDLAGGTEQITGELAADGNTTSFALDRAVFDAKSNPCPQAGTDPKTGKPVTARYTLTLQRDPTQPGGPQGHGYGIATVSASGAVRFTGTLGDSTAVTQSAVISRTAHWPFHTLLYKNGGVLTGDLTFRDLANASDLDGTLDWIKPPLSGATVTYSAGFTTQTKVIGSRYDKTLSVPNGTVSFGEGNLGVVVSPVPVINTGGHLAASPAVAGFSIQLTKATGLFTGTLPTAASAKPLKFKGAWLQKSRRGYGSFVGPVLPAGGLPTGYVEFAAP